MNKPVKPGTTVIGPGGQNLVDDILVQGTEHYGRHWSDTMGSPTWTEVTEEAPSDGQTYGRKNATWTPVTGATGGLAVTEIVPAIANVGNATNIVAHVYGTGFTATTEVLWTGNPLDTAFVSANELTITIDPTMATAPQVDIAASGIKASPSSLALK